MIADEPPPGPSLEEAILIQDPEMVEDDSFDPGAP
jgi:hypothetical protein